MRAVVWWIHVRGLNTVLFVIGGCGRGVGTLDRRIHDGCINASTEKASSYILCHHCYKLHSSLFETKCRMVAPGTAMAFLPMRPN